MSIQRLVLSHFTEFALANCPKFLLTNYERGVLELNTKGDRMLTLLVTADQYIISSYVRTPYSAEYGHRCELAVLVADPTSIEQVEQKLQAIHDLLS